MATALLISGQVQAATPVSSQEELENAVKTSGEYYLTKDIQLNAPLQIAESYANDGKVIVLDLNGKTLSNNPAKKISVIELFKGTLTIKNGTVSCSYPAAQDSCKEAIIVHGVYQDNANWSNLTIAKGASVLSDKNAISVLEFRGNNLQYYATYLDIRNFDNTGLLNNGVLESFNGGALQPLPAVDDKWKAYYFTTYPAQTGGDNPGVVNTDTTASNAYNKTTNKTGWRLASALSIKTLAPKGYSAVTANLPAIVDYTSSVYEYYKEDVYCATAQKSTTTSYTNYYACYRAGLETGAANGVNITIDGYVKGEKYGIKVNGALRIGGENKPFIKVSETGEVACAPNTQSGLKDKESTAIYCSGNAKWEIKGNVHGNIGVTVKGGEVVIDGATITATGTGYQEVFAGGSGINGGAGTGILVSSQAGYTGGQNITIKGDTKVSANDGFAITETIPEGDKDNKTKVSSITIEGGTITGGSQGAMAFTDEGAGKTTVVGGNVDGSTHVGDDPEDRLEDLKGPGTFITEVEVGETTVFVVTKGTAPAPDSVSLAATLADSANVLIKSESVKIEESKVLGYVEMSGETSDTIVSGVTLRIGKLVMGNEAQLVIMPGAKLIVYGEQGVVAGKTSNLVIKADSTGMGTFLFNPAVTSNRTPMATVEFYAKTFDVFGNTLKYKWDIMVSPFKTITALSNNQAGKGYLFAYQYWNGKKWVRYANKAALIESATAFQPIALGNSTPKATKTIYTFEGELQGNISGEFNLERGYNFMGNGYVAPMDSKSIIDEAVKAGNVESALYIWNFDNQNYDTYTLDNISLIPNMNALGFFVLKATGDVKVNLNYNKLIWEYNNK